LATNFRDVIRNVFYSDEKEQEQAIQRTAELQNKTANVFGVNANQYSNPTTVSSPRVQTSVRDAVNQSLQAAPANIQPKINPVVVPTKQQTTENGKGDIAKVARKYIGTPYVWGGESMEEGGMDCSGFVYNALKDSGFNVGRTSAQGYRGQGTVVSKADMQPGDLIFFGSNPKEASHIGIYIGNGQMIHSAGGSKNTKNNPGKGVSIVSVDHRKDFLEARRY
jgi:cell wall-associated NlpC family hydrolase